MSDQVNEAMDSDELEQVSGGVGPKENRYYCPFCYRRIDEASYIKDGKRYFRCAACGREDIYSLDVKRRYADFSVVNDSGFWPHSD